MKLIVSGIIVLCALFIPQAFGESSLQNTELYAESEAITLDISFGQDKHQQLLYKTLIYPQLDSVNIKFYGDEVILHNPEVKVAKSGNYFRISSVEDSIIMYGYKNSDNDNYKINIYYGTNNALIKFSVVTTTPPPEDKVVDTIITIPEVTNQYEPELIIASSHDFKTYWKQDFNLDVHTFDAKINPSATGFEGKIDGVDITAIISLDDYILATLKGVTEYGVWKSDYYIKENLVTPGEYTVDIIASYLDQTISKSSSMFIVGSVVSDGSAKHAPIAIAGEDQTQTGLAEITLDGSNSSDSDADSLTYSWSITSVPVTSSITTSSLSDSTAISPTFTPDELGDYIIELTVTDTTSRTGTDTVTITIT